MLIRFVVATIFVSFLLFTAHTTSPALNLCERFIIIMIIMVVMLWCVVYLFFGFFQFYIRSVLCRMIHIFFSVGWTYARKSEIKIVRKSLLSIHMCHLFVLVASVKTISITYERICCVGSTDRIVMWCSIWMDLQQQHRTQRIARIINWLIPYYWINRTFSNERCVCSDLTFDFDLNVREWKIENSGRWTYNWKREDDVHCTAVIVLRR